jgi:hypothetical protein
MRLPSTLLICALLAACSLDSPPPPPPPAGQAAETPGTIEDQFDPVRRAKDAEGDVLQGKEAQDEAMEAQGGSA